MERILFVFAGIFGNDIAVTFGLCLLGTISVAIAMRFFIKPILQKLDDYFKTKVTSEKAQAVYGVVKSAIYTGFAFILTATTLGMLYKVCKFPYNNSPFLCWLYFIPMFALQWFFDAKMKRLACRIFGLKCDSSIEEEEDIPKPKKPKIKYKKVAYTVDDDGNEVPLD